MLVTNAVIDRKSAVFQQKDSEVRMCTDILTSYSNCTNLWLDLTWNTAL